MEPRLIFNVVQLLAILAILAGVAWLLLRGAPDRGRTFRWTILAVAAVVALVVAISLATGPLEETRSDTIDRSQEVTP